LRNGGSHELVRFPSVGVESQFSLMPKCAAVGFALPPGGRVGSIGGCSGIWKGAPWRSAYSTGDSVRKHDRGFQTLS